MPSKYVKKTNQRRYADRKIWVRAVHRDPPDIHKLCEVLIRLTLQEMEITRAERRVAQVPETLRPEAASEHDRPNVEKW